MTVGSVSPVPKRQSRGNGDSCYTGLMTPKRSELSDEQRRALEHLQGKPLYIVDANTQETYVLLPAEAYRRAQALFDDDFAALDMYAATSKAFGKAGWDDPALDAYNDYDANRSLS